MEGNEIIYSSVPDKAPVKNKIQKEKRLQAEIKKLQRKQFLKNPKRNFMANIGKGGIIVEQPYFIYDEGYNVTPDIIKDPSFPNILPTEMSQVSTILSYRLGPGNKQDFTKKLSIGSISPQMRTGLDGRASIVSRMSASTKISTAVSMATMFLEQPGFSSENFHSDEFKEEYNRSIHEVTSTLAPSMFQLRINPLSYETKLKTTFTVNLVETETIFMLKIPSTAEFLESEEGKLISESNSLYENALNKNKAISQTATQTDGVFRKNRKLLAPRNTRANASTFVASWKLYDAYEAMRITAPLSINSQEEGKVVFLDEDAEKAVYNIKFDYLGSYFDNRLLVALMVMERLIVNDHYRENHLIYNGLLVQNPLSLEVLYNYSLTHLWTFYNKDIVGKRAVTSMCWNKANPNILAVGYGNFHYNDKCKGLVCIWNAKNPIHPERHYKFEHPVTFVTFNPKKKQILAVTFYNGSVLLIDFISCGLLIKASNEHYPLYYPVWQAQWFPSESTGYGQVLITCGENGRLYRYRKNKFFMSKKIMTIGKVHGKIQGVEQARVCYAKKVLISTSVHVLVSHPLDPLLYLVGTSDGCVYICSILYTHDYIEVFQAHTGPVYNIQFNPFCEKVFLTCGADWCIRIWAEKVYVPLITLQSGMVPVEDAIWSPLHSTIVFSVTGTLVEIWDIQRCISTPKSSISSPSGSFNTKLIFTNNGFNVCIGDKEGNIHVMAMKEMPFSPNYQEEILVQALMGAMTIYPELISKLTKLGKPFSDILASHSQTKVDHNKLQLLFKSAQAY